MNTGLYQQKSVLHVTPHLGGGVGSVLLNYLAQAKNNSDFRHDVLCFDYANEKAWLASQTIGFVLIDKMSSDHEGLLRRISAADVILIHWWNHPLLYTFLVRETLPPARVIFWSHISGFHPPYVFTKSALHYPDLFVFTSPLSLDVPEVVKLPDKRKKHLRVVWSTGGVRHAVSVQPKPHKGFNVGYIGTVDYGKIYPHFLKMSNTVELPDIHFIVCGGPSEKEIQKQAKQYDGGKRFTFTGQINNICNYLEIFDVFGYPLAPYHYGTCEQSLGECMAAGIPPVVLANRTESYIVENGVTGFVAKDEISYVQAIEVLYHNLELRKRLAANARKRAIEFYSLNLMIDRWEKIYDEAMHFPKTPKQWAGKRQGKNVSAAYVFIEALGVFGREFENSLTARDEKSKEAALNGLKKLYHSSRLWASNSRGTAKHYSQFFPLDDNLRFWRDLATVEFHSTNTFDKS